VARIFRHEYLSDFVLINHIQFITFYESQTYNLQKYQGSLNIQIKTSNTNKNYNYSN